MNLSSEHPFAQYVRILGKGKTGSRHLSQEEAFAAFSMILRGEVEQAQLGAFLMLLRVKEETAEELAGFVSACRAYSAQHQPESTREIAADLDWSSYAGKKHQHPWFILALLLLAQAGYRVLIHGCAGHTPGRLYTEQAFIELGLPVAQSWLDVPAHLDTANISYLPLSVFCAPLDDIIGMRHLFGLRSPVNTLSRMINPGAADTSIQSVFHPAYAGVHQQADSLLQQPKSLVFKGESGEIEVKPHADTRLYRIANGEEQTISIPRVLPDRVNAVAEPSSAPVKSLWLEEQEDEYGLAATLATASAALLALQPELSHAQALDQANNLWRNRSKDVLS